MCFWVKPIPDQFNIHFRFTCFDPLPNRLTSPLWYLYWKWLEDMLKKHLLECWKINLNHKPSLSHLEYAQASKKQAFPLQPGKAPTLRTHFLMLSHKNSERPGEVHNIEYIQVPSFIDNLMQIRKI